MITIFVTVAILNFLNSYYGHACNSYKMNGQKNLPILYYLLWVYLVASLIQIDETTVSLIKNMFKLQSSGCFLHQ